MRRSLHRAPEIAQEHGQDMVGTGLALAVAVLVAGCGALSRPPDRVELIPSQWEIVSVRGSAIDDATLPTLAIGRSNSARLGLRCGEVDLRYVSDSDGSALTFGEQRVSATCATPADPEDAAIRSAIVDVGEWRVESATSIELVDEGGHALLSLRATTCDCPHQPAGTAGPTPS
jgi:hypothetical protein